jgi:hypothetical protein
LRHDGETASSPLSDMLIAVATTHQTFFIMLPGMMKIDGWMDGWMNESNKERWASM